MKYVTQPINLSTSASYRIITIQNTIGKLLEKIVARKLDKKKLLPPTLGSYRRGKDTWTNAALLASGVCDGFERGEETMVVALDLEDAYNRVSYKVLMRTLLNMEVGAALFKRKVALCLGTWASDVIKGTPGLPQGSALSPVIFNVYTVGITSNQLEGPGRVLSFADDVLAYRRGKDRQIIATGVQQELDRIDTWCDEKKAKIHPGKASVLWCSLNNRAVKDVMPEVKYSGAVIKREPTLRYLGLIFDRSLSGKDHITRVVAKARRKGLTAVKMLAYAKMPQRVLVILFQTLVISVVEYGLGLLPLSDTQLIRLEVIRNEGMRTIKGHIH